MIETVAPGFYRSAFITRALSGMTLWEFLRADDDPTVRAHVVELARHAIDTMHNGGVLHADLNLHNLFVSKAGERLIVVVLDLDKAQLFDGPVPPGRRRVNFTRLARSARKLDPDRRYLDRKALAILGFDVKRKNRGIHQDEVGDWVADECACIHAKYAIGHLFTTAFDLTAKEPVTASPASRWCQRCASASISMRAWRGNAATCTVERAG